jgi:hypothetical protein
MPGRPSADSAGRRPRRIAAGCGCFQVVWTERPLESRSGPSESLAAGRRPACSRSGLGPGTKSYCLTLQRENPGGPAVGQEPLTAAAEADVSCYAQPAGRCCGRLETKSDRVLATVTASPGRGGRLMTRLSSLFLDLKASCRPGPTVEPDHELRWHRQVAVMTALRRDDGIRSL